LVQRNSQSATEKCLEEIFDARIEEFSFEKLDYLKNLRGLLPFLAEISPSIQRYIRAYKEAFFQDPLVWRRNEALTWLPLSPNDRLAMGQLLGFVNYFYYCYPHTSLEDPLPGQQEFVEAYKASESDQPDQSVKLFKESLQNGFNPAGIVLGNMLMKRKEYAQAISVFQEVIRNGAQSAFPELISWLLTIVADGEITALEASSLISQLDCCDAITLNHVHTFFKTLANPKRADANFFKSAATIRSICDWDYWDFLLKWVRKQDAMPTLFKIQMHLVGQRSPKRVSTLPSRINSKKWIETVDDYKYPVKLRYLTTTFLLQSKPKDCDILLKNVESKWYFEQWVEKERLNKKVTPKKIDKARFFWKGLRRILKAWKEGDRLEIKEIQSILKSQKGLAKDNRDYKRCLELCSKHLKNQPPSTHLPEFRD